MEPIKQRRTESEGRDEKVTALKDSLSKTNKLVDSVRDQVEKAEAEASKSASSLAASATASVDTDGLEDDDEATSTSSSKAPAPSTFSPYSNEDLSSISKLHSEISAWLEEKTTAQNKLTAHEDPVLTIKDLEAKAAKLSDAMLELIQKKIRQPKPSSSSSKKSKSKTSKTKKNKSSTSTSATDEAETDAPEAAEESTGPKIVNMDTEHGQMPTEEEVLKILKAMGDNKEEGHDEL